MKDRKAYWEVVIDLLIPLIREQIKVLQSDDEPKQKLFLLNMNIFTSEEDLKISISRWVEEHIFTHEDVRLLPQHQQKLPLKIYKIEAVFFLN
jgi:hypothetical protein